MRNRRYDILNTVFQTGWLVKGFLVILFIFTAFVLPAQTDNNARVNQVKAAYLLNLTKFVYWNSVPGYAEPEQLTIGLIRADGIAGVLDEFIKKNPQGAGIVVKRLNSWDSDLTGCHLVYIDQSQRDHLKKILTRIKGTGVLTVSDIEGFTRAGGMIGLVPEEGRIKIEINLTGLTDSGLEVSAKLIEVARVIKEEDLYE